MPHKNEPVTSILIRLLFL